MTNLNFPPNPAAQTPTNEFSPTSTPDSTSNGVSYIWDGEKWVASGNSGGGGGGEYLPLSGGDLTGDLGVDGSITANGDVLIQSGSLLRVFDNTGASNRCEISADAAGSIINSTYTIGGSGDLRFQTVGVDRASLSVGGDLQIGGTLPSAPNITLASDGSLTAKGQAIIGDDSTNTYTRFFSSGGIRCYREASGSEGFGLYDPSGAKISLKMDGSITAAGNVIIGQNQSGSIGNNQDGVQLKDYGFGLFLHSDTNNGAFITCSQTGQASDLFSVSGDGSITAAGAARAVAAVGAAGGYRHAQTAAGYYLQDDAGNSPISLFKDGSAEFADGDLTITSAGRLDSTEVNTYGAAGFIANNSPGSGGFAWRGVNASGTNTSEIDYDGTATFAGPVKIGGTAEANEISEYEEGTWIPNVGGNTTYIYQGGSYTKIGRVVIAKFEITIDTLGTGSTQRIENLPFGVTGADGECPGAVNLFLTLAFQASSVVPYAASGTTRLFFNTVTAGGSYDMNINTAIFQDGARIAGSVTYFTD